MSEEQITIRAKETFSCTDQFLDDISIPLPMHGYCSGYNSVAIAPEKTFS